MKEEALKLADELQDYMTSLGWKTHQAPAMIRRLVEELDKANHDLKKYDELAFDDLSKPQTKPLSDWEIDESFDRTASHMANEYVSHYEPTAWINHIKQTGGDFYELNVSGRGEPLYRHPPQTKPLSDDEVWDLFQKTQHNAMDFARAIEERHGIK